MRVATLILCIILSGCAASPERLELVGKTEAGRMAPPVKRFSSYANYELKPMVLSAAVQSERAKVEAAGELENIIRTKLQSLLEQWKAATSGNRSGTLVIEPQLASLRIVSVGARFWVGGLVGDSSIDMDLVITDQAGVNKLQSRASPAPPTVRREDGRSARATRTCSITLRASHMNT